MILSQMRHSDWRDDLLREATPGGHFLVVPGLPRPEWLGGGSEALSVQEILALLRRPAES